MFFVEFADGGDELGGGVVVFGKEAADAFVVVVGHFADVFDSGEGVVFNIVVNTGDRYF